LFYCVDKTTGKRTSLKTTNRDEAQQIIEAKNQSVRKPVLNLQIAKAYLVGTDNGISAYGTPLGLMTMSPRWRCPTSG
jgi:hypothetical protein